MFSGFICDYTRNIFLFYQGLDPVRGHSANEKKKYLNWSSSSDWNYCLSLLLQLHHQENIIFLLSEIFTVSLKVYFSCVVLFYVFGSVLYIILTTINRPSHLSKCCKHAVKLETGHIKVERSWKYARSALFCLNT